MDTDQSVWYDEKTGVVFNTGKPASTAEAAKSTLRRVAQLMEGKPRRLLLVDLTDAPLSLDADVRKVLAEESKGLNLERQGFVVPNPVIRMLAKAIARMTGAAAKAAFFATTEEAVQWLQGEGD
ncbi:MAG: hypothetical protein HY898_19275 [Deltaproteobacteria bacterium]|nr:hypothetical protein [Deltaproteobacteria bacterium]